MPDLLIANTYTATKGIARQKMWKIALAVSDLQVYGFDMSNDITPSQVEAAAVAARLPLTTFIKRAGVSPSAFYRWRNGDRDIRPLTKAKLADAMVLD